MHVCTVHDKDDVGAAVEKEEPPISVAKAQSITFSRARVERFFGEGDRWRDSVRERESRKRMHERERMHCSILLRRQIHYHSPRQEASMQLQAMFISVVAACHVESTSSRLITEVKQR